MPVSAKQRYAMKSVKTARRRTSVRGRGAMMPRTLSYSGPLRPAVGYGVPASRLVGNKPEIKSVDLVAGPVTKPTSTTAQFTLLNAIQEGSSFYNRVGRKIMMRSLHLTGLVFQNQGGAGVDEYLRHMIVYDRQPNGAVPSIADILLDYDNTGTTTTNSLSGLNMNNADRFVILRDMRVAIPKNDDNGGLQDVSAAVIDYTTNRVNINEFVLLKNLETHYKATTNPGVIGDIASGALWFVQFGNVAAATAAYAVAFQARLRYHDV